jgi:hypothetical protein
MAIIQKPVAPSEPVPNIADLLTPAEFAHAMPFSLGTLNNSRLTGVLMGVEAPKFYRFGRLVRYHSAERQVWLARFSTAQTSGEHYHRKSSERKARHRNHKALQQPFA